MYNFGANNQEVNKAEDQLSEVSEDEFGNVVIKKSRRMNRQIEEGMYGGDIEDLKIIRGNSIHDIHNDLEAVDEDEFDRIIDEERKIRKRQSRIIEKQKSASKARVDEAAR